MHGGDAAAGYLARRVGLLPLLILDVLLPHAWRGRAGTLPRHALDICTCHAPSRPIAPPPPSPPYPPGRTPRTSPRPPSPPSQMFTLDTSIGEFVLTHPNVKVPDRGSIYSMNEANRPFWDPPLRAYVEDIQRGKGESEVMYTSRYIGSMVRASRRCTTLHRLRPRRLHPHSQSPTPGLPHLQPRPQPRPQPRRQPRPHAHHRPRTRPHLSPAPAPAFTPRSDANDWPPPGW